MTLSTILAAETTPSQDLGADLQALIQSKHPAATYTRAGDRFTVALTRSA